MGKGQRVKGSVFEREVAARFTEDSEHMSKTCPECGAAFTGKSTKLVCSRKCGNASYRRRNLVKVKAKIVEVNGARLKKDLAFRAKHRASTTRWRTGVQKKIAGDAKDNGGYRSKMEARLVPPLLEQGAKYEPMFLRYRQQRVKRYTPDVVLPNSIALEIKGWFKASDRSKMIDVKATYPELDLRMVLATPNQTLAKTSKTTQAQWCEQHGFPWADNAVPLEWLQAPDNPASRAVIESAALHMPQRRRKQ